MKALTLVDVKKFDIIEKDIPKATDNKVVIKVSKAGICGSDIHMIWSTGYGAGQNFVIGHEFSGTIYDAGSSKSFKVGDRVVAMEIDPCLDCDFCNNNQPNLCDHVLDGGPGIGSDGGYGQYVAVREDMVRLLPNEVSDVSGALVEPASISMHAVKLAGVKEGSKVLVTGGGAIGLFAAACAYALGAKTVAITEVNEERLALAADADFVTHAFNGLDKDLEEKLKAINEGGFDAVIECTGNKNAGTTALHTLRKGGHMALVAYGQQPDIDLFTFINSEFHLSGSVFFTTQEFELVIDLMAKKKLNLEKYAKLITMEEVQPALEGLEKGTENAVKYIIDMNK